MSLYLIIGVFLLATMFGALEFGEKPTYDHPHYGITYCYNPTNIIL